MDKVLITSYRSEFKDAFKILNKEWIDKYFVMEAADHRSLEHPEEYIIKNGGNIFYAIIDDLPVGVCALVKSNHPLYDYELSKMAVTGDHQGKGIGRSLAEKVISEARLAGGQSIFLESNTILEPAIMLYRSLGFKKIDDFISDYERSNIQMVLKL